jgi:hypothetical protein
MMRQIADTDTHGMRLDESLQPDVILPVQLHADVRALREPERR